MFKTNIWGGDINCIQGVILIWVQIQYAYHVLSLLLITKLDNTFLQNIGGVNGNSFVNMLNPEIDEECEENFPQIIYHSSYYDSGALSSTLQTCKNTFTILSTNIQFINAKIDELRLFICLIEGLKLIPYNAYIPL